MDLLCTIADLTSFGAAGLMGAMWLCERRLSQRRERQLCEAHHRIARDEERLDSLTGVVEKNTSAIVRFIEHQRQQTRLLMQFQQEMRHAHRP
jgi:hypothetical protein